MREVGNYMVESQLEELRKLKELILQDEYKVDEASNIIARLESLLK